MGLSRFYFDFIFQCRFCSPLIAEKLVFISKLSKMNAKFNQPGKSKSFHAKICEQGKAKQIFDRQSKQKIGELQQPAEKMRAAIIQIRK